jgi:hypothetical protein
MRRVLRGTPSGLRHLRRREEIVDAGQTQLKLIEGFEEAGALPDNISTEFVSAMSEALSGLEKITVTTAALRTALVSAGSAATVSELGRRFEEYLSTVTKGKDTTKVRIVLE